MFCACHEQEDPEVMEPVSDLIYTGVASIEFDEL